MKCLKGPVPRVVATASGEAAADQEMAHLLLTQELSAQYTPGGLDNRLGCPPSAQSLVLARRTPKTRFGWDT